MNENYPRADLLATLKKLGFENRKGNDPGETVVLEYHDSPHRKDFLGDTVKTEVYFIIKQPVDNRLRIMSIHVVLTFGSKDEITLETKFNIPMPYAMELVASKAARDAFPGQLQDYIRVGQVSARKRLIESARKYEEIERVFVRETSWEN